jgi:hypothetical protein
MAIHFQLETEINKPLKEVVRLFSDRSQYPNWQPGLLETELVAQQPHPTYQLLFQFGRRKMKMKEMILAQNLPASYTVHYVTKGVENTVHITFEAVSDTRTRYISKQIFRFKGIMILLARFIKDGLQKQSEIIMNNFKRYAEKA